MRSAHYNLTASGLTLTAVGTWESWDMEDCRPLLVSVPLHRFRLLRESALELARRVLTQVLVRGTQSFVKFFVPSSSEDRPPARTRKLV